MYKKRKSRIKKICKNEKKLINIYKVILPKEYLNLLTKSGIRINNLATDTDNIIFNTNSIRLIKNSNYNYIKNEMIIENILKMKVKNGIKNYFVTILGIVLLLIVLLILSKTITEVKFKNEDYYNQEVYDYVLSKLDYYNVNDKIKFAFVNNNLESINKDLRSTFFKYQWISINKNGTILYIDIAKTSDVDEIKIEDNTSGGLYSLYDAIVEGYYVKSGKILVKKNMSVSVGDELISGRIEQYGNEIIEVKAEGYVIADVIDYEVIEISKVLENTVRSGKVEVFKIYTIFGKSFGKIESSFENYETEYITKNKIGNILEIIYVYCYELLDSKTIYTLEEAIDYGKSIISNSFNSSRKYEFEKINNIDYLDYEEDNEAYYLRYLIMKHIDITEFKEYNENKN